MVLAAIDDVVCQSRLTDCSNVELAVVCHDPTASGKDARTLDREQLERVGRVEASLGAVGVRDAVHCLRLLPDPHTGRQLQELVVLNADRTVFDHQVRQLADDCGGQACRLRVED